MQLKICGVTNPDEVSLLASLPVDLIGIWYGVPGGHADVSLAQCRRLAAAASATGTLEPVLVTFLNDAADLREAALRSRVRWLQLHGYQPPGLVRAVKAAAPGTRVIKVLHVRGEHCAEARLIRAYEKAGVDVFLLDAVDDDGRTGSTGRPLDAGVVRALAARLTRPFLLAGGVSARNRRQHTGSMRCPNWLGIDVDSNARGPDGALRAGNVRSISRAWRAHADIDGHHVRHVPR